MAADRYKVEGLNLVSLVGFSQTAERMRRDDSLTFTLSPTMEWKINIFQHDPRLIISDDKMLGFVSSCAVTSFKIDPASRLYGSDDHWRRNTHHHHFTGTQSAFAFRSCK